MTTNDEHHCRDHEKTKADIEKYGLSVIMLRASGYRPSFAYSVGLWEKFKHPEIICFGFSTETLHGLVNDAAELVKSGSVIVTNKIYNNFFEKNDTAFVKVDPLYLSDYFDYGINYYQSEDFPALQFVWTDRNNKFPWEEGFEEEFIYKQPLLDRSTDFKFREVKSLAVFTTRQWLYQDKPIIRVVHDNDGDWQFLTGDQILADASIVCLEDMTKKDPSLNEVFNLDYGEEANRNFIGDNWERSVSENNDDEEDTDE